MHDTVKIWYDSSLGLPADFMETRACITDQHERISKETGLVKQSGKLRNLILKSGEQGLHISGSLAKFHFGSNAHVLTRHDAEEAVKELSDLLHLPVERAKVCRFDLAQNFIMQRPVSDYICRMTEARYFKRDDYSDRQSVLFKNSLNAIVLYDKLRQLEHCRRHGEKEPIPELFQGRNVLRIENRFLRRLGRQFDRQSVTVADLYEPIFYKTALTKYRDGYFLIQKTRKETALDMRNVKTYEQSLAFFGLQNIGGYEMARQIIQSAFQRGAIQKHTYYKLLKKTRALALLKNGRETGDIIHELDEKVMQAVACYR
jgi:hypothetical protein